MAIETGDLYPRSSGSASLGAEQVGVCGFTDDIRPFCHVHMNSGVWHDPTYGQSGVVRFNQVHDAFEVSVDGGLTFDLLPTSGQLSPHTQQAAFDGGNEIQTERRGTSYQGVVVLEPSTPFNSNFGWDDSLDPTVGHTSYGIAVSGAPTPGFPQRSSLARLTSQWLHLRPSGNSLGSTGGAFLGFQNGLEDTMLIHTSGAFSLDTKSSVIESIGGSKISSIEGSYQVTSNTSFVSYLANTNIGYIAGTSIDFFSSDRFDVQCYNGSGRLEYRFGPYEAWHTLVGAGNTDLVPIPHSGHVLQMILENGGGSPSLQGSYDGGNEINQDAMTAGPPLASANFFTEHTPVVVKQTTPGAGLPDAHGILNGIRDAAIVASGFTLTPDLLSTFAHTSIGPGYMTMQGSGAIAAPENAGTLMLAAANSPIFGPVALMNASGLFFINATGGTIFTQNGIGDLVFQNLGEGNTTGLGGQVRIEAFAASGRLQYRLGGVGGHEAWHWRPSYESVGGPNSDGFHPLPHSGQVLQMILENGGGGGTLQQAYNAGQRIITFGGVGPVHIDGDTTYGLRIDVAENDHTHLLVSGVVQLPDSVANSTPGAMWLQASSYGDGPAQLQGGSIPTTRAEASAKSLGIDTMFMTTGSGIVSLRAASGVSQFFNVGGGGEVDDVGKIVPLSVETTASTFYHVASASGVQIFVPGFYRVSYVCVLEKNLGNLGQQVDTELRVRDKWGQEFKLLGSDSSAIMRDSNTLNKNTCNGQALTDLDPGDALVIYCTHNGAVPAGNRVVIPARLSNIIVEWIGPQAGGKLIHQGI